MLKKLLAPMYRHLPVAHELCQIRELLAQLIERTSALQTIRLMDFDLEQHPRYGDAKRLLRYQSQVTSQNGEDGILQEIFRRIGTTNRIFAEIGIGNGCENNTAFLLSQGWNGFWIDGAEGFVKTLEGRPDLQGDCLKWLVAFVSKENVSGLFDQLMVPLEFDLLSLDIDQNTYYAWEGLQKFKPRVVVVEYNASIPAAVEWKVNYDAQRTWDGSLNFGASLKAFEILGNRLGYKLVGCEFLGANAFFVREDLVEDKFMAPFTSENHYEAPRYSMGHKRGHPASILDREKHPS